MSMKVPGMDYGRKSHDGGEEEAQEPHVADGRVNAYVTGRSHIET